MSEFSSRMSSVVCGVCETVQPPASRCAVCDLPLRVPAGVPLVGDPPLEPLPGLERTAYDAISGRPAEALFGLERTAWDEEGTARTGEMSAPEVLGLERTEHPAAALRGLQSSPLEGLEPTGVVFEKSDPGELDVKPCAWCGFPAGAGECPLCGRKSGQGDGKTLSPSGHVRCFACGAHVRSGALCSDCGLPLRTVDSA